MSKSVGPFKAGDVLTCSSDGYPEPSYQWTDADGAVVATGARITLTNSSFNSSLTLNCTATGDITNICGASAVVHIHSPGMFCHSVNK